MVNMVSIIPNKHVNFVVASQSAMTVESVLLKQGENLLHRYWLNVPVFYFNFLFLSSL